MCLLGAMEVRSMEPDSESECLSIQVQVVWSTSSRHSNDAGGSNVQVGVKGCTV